MANFIKRSLTAKLIASFVAVAVLPLSIVGFLAFQSARAALEKTLFDRLVEERDLRKKDLMRYFQGTVETLQFLADTPFVKESTDTLASYHEYGKTSADAPFDVKSDLYIKMYAKINRFFQSFMGIHDFRSTGYHDFLIISARDGHVMYSAAGLADLGANLRTGELKDSGIARLWNQVVKTKEAAMVDFMNYAPVKVPMAFVGVPVTGEDGQITGVLAMRMGPEQINLAFAASQAAGKTAGSYLVGEDMLMRSNARSETASSILTRKVETEPAKEAMAGNAGAIVAKDYRGELVLSAFSRMGLRENKKLGADFDWAVLADVDSDEAFVPVHALGFRIMLISLAIGVAVVLPAFFIARGVARPVTGVAEAVGKVSEGDLAVKVPALNREDELGHLVKAFRIMVANLREQTRQIMEVMSVLSSSASEISATVAQLAMSTSKTSSAVAETTATVEQVRQAAKLASEKAKKVAESAVQSLKISESGKKATEDTMHGMDLIKEQVESIGETVVRLSEHSQAIEDIIKTVQDLASQSNLLAVNASIEAARAGDQGKGFAVVAHEIKTLADQSKQATEQVRTILEDTRKWVSAVVMATEQGSKAVDAGVAQSTLAGQSIRSLTDGASESSEAATVIHASSEQQAAGVEQVAGAMANISQAMEQNMAGTAQLESAARKLEELGLSLKELVGRYKI